MLNISLGVIFVINHRLDNLEVPSEESYRPVTVSSIIIVCHYNPIFTTIVKLITNQIKDILSSKLIMSSSKRLYYTYLDLRLGYRANSSTRTPVTLDGCLTLRVVRRRPRHRWKTDTEIEEVPGLRVVH